MVCKISERISLMTRKPEPSTPKSTNSVEDRKERERLKRIQEEQQRSLRALRPEVPKEKVRTQSFDSSKPSTSQRPTFHTPAAGNGRKYILTYIYDKVSLTSSFEPFKRTRISTN